MPAPTEAIRVSVQRSPQSIRLVSPEDVIQVWIDGIDRINKVRNDFAAWYFLPIAMRTGRDLRIEGEGSEETIRNARRISEIWETWLPHHFTAVNVSFDTVSPRRAADGPSQTQPVLLLGRHRQHPRAPHPAPRRRDAKPADPARHGLPARGQGEIRGLQGQDRPVLAAGRRRPYLRQHRRPCVLSHAPGQQVGPLQPHLRACRLRVPVQRGVWRYPDRGGLPHRSAIHRASLGLEQRDEHLL